MKQNNLQLAILVCSFLSLASCATLSPKSIRDVPKINSANVNVPPLKNIPQHAVNLTIMDNRSPQYKQNSVELQTEVRRAVVQGLKSQGISINQNSTNSLLLSVQDEAMGEYKDGCVKMNSILAISQVANIYTDATSCFEVKSPVSTVSMGSDINESYEMALSAIFQGLSNSLQKVEPTKK
ncbi:MAG TPA: hypothetical protein VN132_10575 [Bdellovibrio sp.]|nr:hypothetical protein [Bdellovibrio sp.]